MKILESTHVELQWPDIASRVSHPRTVESTIRASGVHLSAVLRYVAVTTKILDLSKFEDREDAGFDESVIPLRMCLGVAWEEFAAGLYPDMVWQPGELELDGVSGNRDGYSFIEEYRRPFFVVDEFKFTQKSARRPIESEWMWLQQVRGYCKMQEEATGEESRWARLHVCYVNGEYEWVRGGEPKYMRYLVEFERREIDATWNQIVLPNKGKEGVVRE